MPSTLRPPADTPAVPNAGRVPSDSRFTLRPAVATIDLGALGANLQLLRAELGATRVLAVVKADAYGHGAVEVGRCLERAGIDWLGVALVEEGVELRRAGLSTPILVLGPVHRAQLPLLGRYELTPTVSSGDQLALWEGWASSGGPGAQTLHLKVDTGMGRLGLDPEEVPSALERIRTHPRLRLGGLLSHLADAEEPEGPRNAAQESRFASLLELLTVEERARLELHLANSAGALHRHRSRHGLARVGLALFGLDPARRRGDLRPVMSVHARIVQLRRVPAGARIGYGGRWAAPRPSLVAVVPVGYADGYPWRLSNGAWALVGGRRVPVVGAVSMDMLTLDVTEHGAAVDEEVTLLGAQGGEEIGAHDLADWAGTIPYEILTLLGLRLPRLYLRPGGETGLRSRLLPAPSPPTDAGA